MHRILSNSLASSLGTEERIFDRDQSVELLAKLGEPRRKIC